ncbi:hypothetical protein [Metallosphaera javensis (ex Hofmann et al. 2022)]|nr:hypothetical protein [Metallosphaera javensis (ex Hofmann et al. 2022)]
MFYSVLGGKMNARLLTPELEVEGDFQWWLTGSGSSLGEGSPPGDRRHA